MVAKPERLLEDVPVKACIHVNAPHGPGSMVCKECDLLMLPVHETALTGRGISQWVCFPCWRGVNVTWSVTP